MSHESITSIILQGEGLGYLLPRLLPDIDTLEHYKGRICPMPPTFGYPKGLVFRVENANGRGPYVSGSCARHFKKHQNSENHPAPYASWGVGPDWEDFFGFTSLEALLCWFDDPMDLKLLDQKGFKLGIYYGVITAVCLRTEQCTFRLPGATREVHMTLDPTWHTL